MNIFHPFRRKAGGVDEDAALFMAMVPLQQAEAPDPAELSAVLRRRWRDKPQFGRFKVENQILYGDIGGAVAVIGLMPMPIAPNDIEAACAASFAWPDC